VCVCVWVGEVCGERSVCKCSRPVAEDGGGGSRGSIKAPKQTHKYQVTTINARQASASPGMDQKKKAGVVLCVEAVPVPVQCKG